MNLDRQAKKYNVGNQVIDISKAISAPDHQCVLCEHRFKASTTVIVFDGGENIFLVTLDFADQPQTILSSLQGSDPYLSLRLWAPAIGAPVNL